MITSDRFDEVGFLLFYGARDLNNLDIIVFLGPFSLRIGLVLNVQAYISDYKKQRDCT